MSLKGWEGGEGVGEEDDAKGVALGIKEGLFADEDFGGLAGGELGVFCEVLGFL